MRVPVNWRSEQDALHVALREKALLHIAYCKLPSSWIVYCFARLFPFRQISDEPRLA